jgi:hypothetical protein
MQDNDMQLNADKHYLRHKEYAVSVNVSTQAGMTPDGIATAAQRPWREYHVAEAGVLEDAGYVVRPTSEPDGHTDLVLPGEPTMEDWARLREIFGPARKNPKPVKPWERTV